MDELITKMLNPIVIRALEAPSEATIQLIRYDRATGTSIPSSEMALTTNDESDVRRLFLDTKAYWFGLKRCARLDVARLRFLKTQLEVLLDFRCNNLTFVVGENRLYAFFDPRRDDLVLLVNRYFPEETDVDCATVVKREFLNVPRG